MRFRIALALLLFAAQLSAQWPTPAKTANTPVPCPASCGVGKAGKLTAGWSSPVTGYVGRFLDSSATQELQGGPWRTLRARVVRVVPERDRIYFILGANVVSTKLSTFFARVETERMTRMNRSNGVPEFFLPWQSTFYGESQWPEMSHTDGQDRLFDLDVDDRGMVYPAYSTFGTGALFDDPITGLVSRLNIPPGGDVVDAYAVVSVKSAGRYYLVVSSITQSHSNVWDVTSVATPIRLPNIQTSIAVWTKAGVDRIAVVTATGFVKVYSAAGIIADQPIATFAPPLSTSFFTGITSDGVNFYAVSFRASSATVVSVLSPLAGSYARRDETLAYRHLSGPKVRWGAGWLAVFGVEDAPVFGGNVRFYRTGAALTESPTDYFAKYYSSSQSAALASPNAAQIATSGAGVDALPVQSGSSTYLLAMFSSIGDVYRLAESGATMPTPQPTVTPASVPAPVPCPCPQPAPQPVPVPLPAPTGPVIVAVPPSNLEVGTWNFFQVQPGITGDCRWSFGDGTPPFTALCSRYGSHAYSAAGTFTVSVTASVPVAAKPVVIR
jgi:hypothetical protein